MKNLTYSSREINRNFRIKVFGKNADGRKINTLVGVSGAVSLIGEDLLGRLLVKAFASRGDCYSYRLRRGLKFSFYVK